jgi:hypothetical protein
MVPVSLIVAPNMQIALPETYSFVASLALLWIVASQSETSWLCRGSGWLLLGATLILSCLLLFETRFNPEKLPFISPNFYTLLSSYSHLLRIVPRYNPNLSGGLLALFWAPLLVLAWGGGTYLQRAVSGTLCIAVLGLVLLTQSRGALLGMGVALLVMTSLQHWRWLLFWGAVAVLVIGALYTIGPDIALAVIFRRGDILNDPDLVARQAYWKHAIDLIQIYPLTGIGLGMVKAKQLLGGGSNFHAHNIYLQIGVEMGLPALIVYLAFFVSLLFLLLRQTFDHRDESRRLLALGLLGTLITFMIHGFFEVITYYASWVPLVVWGLFGLMVAVVTRSSPDTSVPEKIVSTDLGGA